MSRPRPLPAPPPTLPPIALLDWTADLWRIQNDVGWVIRTEPEPRFRFDPPAGEFATVYAAADQLTTFAEVYRERGQRLGAEDAGRHLVRLTPRPALALVDLRDPRLLVRLGLDERVSVGDDYGACRAWALALHDAFPAACGICYRSRLAGAAATNVALFAERCAARVTVAAVGRLCELERVVLAAADRYDLTVAIRFG